MGEREGEDDKDAKAPSEQGSKRRPPGPPRRPPGPGRKPQNGPDKTIDVVEVADDAQAEVRKEKHRKQLRSIRDLLRGRQSPEDKAVDPLVADRDQFPAHNAGRLGLTLEDAKPEDLLGTRVPATLTPGYWEQLERSAGTWAKEIAAQPFWAAVERELATCSSEYFAEHKESLIAIAKPFSGKGKDRTREKVLEVIAKEKNGLERLFPGDTPVPRLKDLVRARISTTYLDGVAKVASRLHALLVKEGLADVKLKPQALGRGYYATHLTFTLNRLFQHTTDVTVPVTCEIQVATELATTIWARTHGAYEVARVATDAPDTWQSNPDDARFIAAQLAHMIHLADGLVLQLRDKVAKNKGLKP